MKIAGNFCGRTLLGAALALLGLSVGTPDSFGQNGVILPALGASATNIDVADTATITYGTRGGLVVAPNFGGGGGDIGFENLTNLNDGVFAAGGDQKWLDFGGDTMMMPIHFTLTAAETVKFFTITSGNDAPERDPSSWRLLGATVANPVEADFTEIETRSEVTWPARNTVQLFSVTSNNTAYSTYRFELETAEVAGVPGAVDANSMQIGEFELFENFTFAGPTLTINRSTGNILLTNGTANPLNITGYSVTSARGSLNSSTWTSMHNNYDGDSGGGTPLDTDNWIRLTAANGRQDLSEVENPEGSNGVVRTPGQSIDLGAVWLKSPIQDIAGEVLLADGTTVAATVLYEGGPGAAGGPWTYLDLNFDGLVNPADWATFKAGHAPATFGTPFSAVESYAKGDLDGDLDHDLDDFGIFERTYNLINGAGSFQAMLSVPEPGSVALLAVGALLFSLGRFRRRATFALLLVFSALLMSSGNEAQAGKPLPGLIGGDLTNVNGDATLDVTVTVANVANSPAAEGPPMLLDSSITTKWLSFDPNGTWYQMQFNGNAQHAVNTYTITSANDSPERDPYRWTLSGSNDGVNFTVVDQQSGNLWNSGGPAPAMGRQATQQFVVGNNTPYNIYRFDFLTAQGAGIINPPAVPNSIQIAEVELFDMADPEILTLQVDTTNGNVRIANKTNFDAGVPIAFDAYRIRSPGARLDFAKWSGGTAIGNLGGESIHDTVPSGFFRGNGTGTGWEELLGGASSDSELIEQNLDRLDLGGGILFPDDPDDPDDQILMEGIWRTGPQQDLVFEYHSNGQTVRGFVEYLGDVPNIPGDFNGNGTVELGDFNLVVANWGSAIPPIPGPWTGDPPTGPQVDLDDFNKVVANWGDTAGASTALGVNVPEPGTWMLAMVIPGLLLRARRRAAARSNIENRNCITTSARGGKTMVGASRGMKGISLALVGTACLLLANTTLASTLDRNYEFAGNGNDGAGFADNLTENGGATYVNVQALGRPAATAGEQGLQLSGGSSQYLNGFGLGSPPEGAPAGLIYPANRMMQAWIRPTLDTGARQDVINDTFQFGVHITATDTWGHTFGSGAAPANLGDDFNTGVAVTYNAWTHVMQRSFGTGGFAVYINGVAVSRANNGYTANTTAIAPAPDKNLYVGANDLGAGKVNFFTGQVDDLKIHVSGDTTAGGGQNWGNVDIATENDYIAFALPNMGFVNGDVNGDGVVNGTGAGPAATDDVKFFIDHWLQERRVNNILIGDLTSRTTMGDLNFDGRTSLADWAILRGAHAAGASLDLATLLTSVPEPSTVSLFMMTLLSAWGWGFSRRRSGRV